LPFEDNQFRIEYYSIDPKVAETNWYMATNEICNSAVKVSYQDKYTINSTFRTPVAGQMIELPSQRYIHYGTVKCSSPSVANIELIPAKWQTFNTRTGINEPVSVAYISDTLKISPVKLFQLGNLPVTNTSSSLTKLWHSPLKQFVKDGTLISIWSLDGNGWFPNSVVLSESSSCLNAMEILPPNILIDVMAKNKKMTFEELVNSGSISTYSLKIESCK
jgi:hypothetical protein